MDSALQWLKTMKDVGLHPTRVTYNTLVHGFIRQGDVQRARAVLDEARADGVKPDVWSYTSLMKGYAKEFRTEEMEKCLVELEECGGKANQVGEGVLLIEGEGAGGFLV